MSIGATIDELSRRAKAQMRPGFLNISDDQAKELAEAAAVLVIDYFVKPIDRDDALNAIRAGRSGFMNIPLRVITSEKPVACIQDVYHNKLARRKNFDPEQTMILVDEDVRNALMTEAALLPLGSSVANPPTEWDENFKLFNIKISTIERERR